MFKNVENLARLAVAIPPHFDRRGWNGHNSDSPTGPLSWVSSRSRCWLLEHGAIADSRVTRIVEAIFSSRYLIHDLTRCTGQGTENFARFNMPLELGMAMAARIMIPESGHDWLALAPRGHGYQKYISDLAGYDLETYDESVAGIVGAVMKWLATRPDAVPPPTPRKVVEALPSFAAEVERLETEWHGYPPWPKLIEAAVTTARDLGYA